LPPPEQLDDAALTAKLGELSWAKIRRCHPPWHCHEHEINQAG
jgi:hypothetical protein